MKRLLLALTVFIAGSVAAQTLESVDATIKFPTNAAAFDGTDPLLKTTTCGPDTNGYALAKATGLEALNINNATSAGAVGQYFDAPQAITVSGVSFYAWKPDVTGGITMNVTVQVFAAALDSTPTGAALATATTVVDTTFAPGTLDVLRKHANFLTPVTVTGPYVVVVSNNTPTPMSMVFNSWTAADGLQEWLSSVQIGPNWLRSYDVNVGGSTFDADCLFEPHTSYALTASFLVDDPCFSTGLTLNFTNGSSPVTEHRMYNVAAFQAIPEFSYTWNYGDASPTENLIDATHTYASAGAYTVTLTDTIYGWTTNCFTDTTVTLGGAPTASFTSVESGLSSAFTNTSTTGGGATYIWDFGDGNNSTLSDPAHTYLAAGSYVVCLVVTDGCGANTFCDTVVVTSCSNPIPAFTSSTTGSTASFTEGSTTTGTTTYLWDFGDGNTSTMMNPSHTYTADGNYTVCLTVADSCGIDSTCQTVTITTCVNPIAGFTSVENPAGSGTFDFTNTSTTTGTVTYSWDFGDSNTDATENPTHTYASGGDYTVVLTITDSCGTNSFTAVVNTTVGINELSLADVAVYPNPSNGIFSIEASAEMETAYITDLSGKLIYTGELSGNEATINAAQFANGTYFLSIRFADDMIQTIRLEVVK
ncbi:MAG: PKD domain-containing protein [Crocinitomicaceae bacterium]|nr:PKD domain-containing protein [Crocinitomicaceae bacterium]